MNLGEHISALTDPEHVGSLTSAIESYSKIYPDVDLMMLSVEEKNVLTLDLVDSDWQKPWATRVDFVRERCIYDPETNTWLEYYLDEIAKADDIPPILIYYLDYVEGHYLALIDGVHRTSAYLHADRPFISAWIIHHHLEK